MLNTPVLFLVFNRPDTTRQVFAQIREAKPRQLFVAADGPRMDKEGEKEKCELVRQIATQVDWECEVKTLFREQNLGCGIAVSEAITWFFNNVEQGIILEDDTLPDLSFFRFCEELLDYYADNEQVMHISGSNFQFGRIRDNSSYYFSAYPPIWGWATWKRAWQRYYFNLSEISNIELAHIFQNYHFPQKEINYWQQIYTIMTGVNRTDTWDLQWVFSIWANAGIAINSQINLVSNIGFGEDATHTIQVDSKVSNLRAFTINKISHPKVIKINHKADRFTFNHHVQPSRKWASYIRHKVMPILIPSFIKEILKKYS
jgi:hypothetical protein